jgi:CRP/FNR family cyclic AMP-dependent transcriptional regulator
LVTLLHAGEHFGEMAILDGRPQYVTAIASKEAEVLAIYRDDVLAFLREHAEAALQVALSLCLRLRHITELLADIAFLDLLPRLAKRLCQLAETPQRAAVDGATIRVSQEDLAEMVGATREAVNKQLARLREMTLIETGRGRVKLLDAERLKSIAFTSATEFTLRA